MSKIQLARVRIREFGPIELFHVEKDTIKSGDLCIISYDRGEDHGKILLMESIQDCEIDHGQRVLRTINQDDEYRIDENKLSAHDQISECQKMIDAHHLEMKIIDAEYTYDRRKIVFYFASAERVDFRQLVRDLAKKMRLRIELHQVGIRDETKITGGIGCCGRVICCKSWIHEFCAVNIRMAKLQQIQLHPTKLSGVCGRLKCCLAYEYKSYCEMEKKMPKKGQRVRTPLGTGDVFNVSLLTNMITVKSDEGALNSFEADKVTAISRSKGRAKIKASKRRMQTSAIKRRNPNDKNYGANKKPNNKKNIGRGQGQKGPAAKPKVLPNKANDNS